MTHDRLCSVPSRRRKRGLSAAAGLCLCVLSSVVSVECSQVPKHREQGAEEPDSAHHTTVVNQNSLLASPKPPNSGAQPPRIPQHDAYEDFMMWCTQVLGIQTSLIIQDFEYQDYLKIRMSNEDDEELCDDDVVLSQEETILSVRGLAASHDIQVGDVVISIPFHALLTVKTTIDHDPVLSGLLGPTERARFGWEDSYFETPLLTIAILYHKHLGTHSPLYNYIQLLESNSPHDSMPLLWSKRKLRNEATSGVRKIVRGIQSDVMEMYDSVMIPLKEEHAAIFNHQDYSLQMFQWAFCMVNSRHWYLPIPDLSDRPTLKQMEESEYGSGYNEQVLPASQPTEEWVREQGEQETGISNVQHQQDIRGLVAPKEDSHHSFMAPVADLLNFGPPCTRGSYNKEKKTFELIATCPFLAGQEVTFWYSDDCEDVMIANYGFTHPMVPRCPSADEWREKSELWKQRSLDLETQLEESYKELGRMDVELEDLRLILRKCDCDEEVAVEEKQAPPNSGPTKLRRWRQEPTDEPMMETADGLRGVRDANEAHSSDHARHGIRKKWHHHGSNSGSSL